MTNADHASLISIRKQDQNTHLILFFFFFHTVACHGKVFNSQKTPTSAGRLPHFRYKDTGLVILKSSKLNISVMLIFFKQKTLPAKTMKLFGKMFCFLKSTIVDINPGGNCLEKFGI